MKTVKHTEKDYIKSNWSGGKTTELAIFPPEADYINRDFLWRLSSATTEIEQSTFTKLPDYDRILMVLDGEIVLSYEGNHVTRLKTLEQDRFDGGWTTTGFGKIHDLNLMVRKGSDGYMDILELSSEKQEYKSSYISNHDWATHILLQKEGYSIVNVQGKENMLKTGDTLIIQGDKEEEINYSIMGEGLIIRSQVFYNPESGDVCSEAIPSEKATFDDFKQAIFIANTQFRMAKYIFKSLKNKWYDRQLSDKIEKIEGVYATSIVFFIGLLTLVSLFAKSGISETLLLILILSWILLDCIIISPLIYLFVLPKPISKHIKDIDKLTPYEARLRAEDLTSNKKVEKIIKKYKHSGKNIDQD